MAFANAMDVDISGMRNSHYIIIGVTLLLDDNGMTRYMEVNDEEGWE